MADISAFLPSKYNICSDLWLKGEPTTFPAGGKTAFTNPHVNQEAGAWLWDLCLLITDLVPCVGCSSFCGLRQSHAASIVSILNAPQQKNTALCLLKS
jgi:hypothetical protein